MRRLVHASAVTLSLLLLFSCAMDAAVAAAPNNNKVRFLQPAKYNEVIDLVLDAASLTCDALGERITAPNFEYRLRCDLFLEQLEDLANMCDSMVKEIKLTQKQMVDNAIDGGYDRDLVMYMKRTVKGIFGSRRTSEREVSLELTKDMSQWILDVSVHEMGKPRKSSKIGAGAQMNRMTPAQRAKLREMGVAMPAEDDAVSGDGASQGTATLTVVADESDKQWARETSRQLKKEKKQRGQRKAPPDPTEPPRSSDL